MKKLHDLLGDRQLLLSLLLLLLLPPLHPPKPDKGVLTACGKQQPTILVIFGGKTCDPVLVSDQFANLKNFVFQ